MNRHDKTKRLPWQAILAASVVLPLPAFSQENADADEDAEVYTLSPFEVSSSDDVGYLATQSLAGTRIRTDLKDVGSAISVVTQEFLLDTGATDNSTLLQYTTNAEVAGTRGTYAGLGNGETLDESANLATPGGAQRVRGLASADNCRDFLVSEIPWDGFNVDRIDIQRGPNSILFGLGSPAGIVNASTKKANFTDANEVTFRLGSYGSMRATVDINKELIKDTLAIRIAGLWDEEQFKQQEAYENDERIFATLRWEPDLFKSTSAHTTILANYENGKIDANRPRIIPPYDELTGWFRPQPTDGNWTLENGMGKLPVTNGYDAQDERESEFPAGDPHYGMAIPSADNYQPYLSGVGSGQTPFYFIDTGTGAANLVTAGYMNYGALNPDGTLRGFADGMYGGAYNPAFFKVNGTSQFARNAGLPLAGSGQYRNSVFTDPSVFDFYHHLIDGSGNKYEKEDWDAYNLDISQSFLDNRIAINFVYDKQDYKRHNESLLGGSPTITMDVMQNLQHFWMYPGADGETSITNENYGRPFIQSTGGTGGSYESERETKRLSLFAELRMEDFTDSEFLVKLFGKHRFNLVGSKDDLFQEKRSWARYANSLDWTSFWNGYEASNVTFNSRQSIGLLYLGDSIAGMNSPVGANIPSIGSQIEYHDNPVLIFNPVWTAGDSVDPGDPWTPTGNLTKWYRTPTEEETETWTQASNPANYEGWTFYDLTLDRANGGLNTDMLTNATKSLQKLESKAFSWQGYFWNESLVTTFGWREDKVSNYGVMAPRVTSNQSRIDLSADVYTMELAQEPISRESKSYGAVLHLNKIFENDPLPFNMSVSYNQSENFQIAGTRRDLYGTVLGNPSGETTDWGVLLSTKDNRFSFRAVKFKTKLTNSSSTLDRTWQIGQTIQQGLRFRNVYLYDLGGYTWETRESPSYRNDWMNAYGDEFAVDRENPTDAELAAAQADEDASIRAWNEIQAQMEEWGFFDAWNFDPTPLQYLTDRSTYEATLDENGIPSAQYLPPTENVVAYGARGPDGFTVTEDSVSKGYEFELTANPTDNWRISFNASKTEAIRSNVGGETLTQWVNYMDSMFLDANGNMLPAARLPQWGGASNAIYPAIYSQFRGAYALMKLSEGTPTPEIRKWRFNIVSNYSFDEGVLEGFSVGGGYRWADKAAIGYPVIEVGPNQYEFDFQNPAYGPTEDAIDLWVGYEHSLTDKIDWKIQLNVRNVGAGDSLIPISVQPDGVTPAAYRIAPTQEWFITNTFSF